MMSDAIFVSFFQRREADVAVVGVGAEDVGALFFFEKKKGGGS